MLSLAGVREDGSEGGRDIPEDTKCAYCSKLAWKRAICWRVNNDRRPIANRTRELGEG